MSQRLRGFKTGIKVLGLVICLGWGSVLSADSDTQSGISAAALDTTAPPTTRQALARDKPVTGKHGMVVSAQHEASKIGARILEKGGNAVDAAVAVGYALAVTHPCCGNIGGGGFMTVHMAGDKDHAPRDLFLDFRETAPAKADPELFQDEQGEIIDGLSTDTYLGTAVPGTVMGLEAARKRLGTMSRQALIEPAIRLARDGFTLQSGDTRILSQRTADFAQDPNVAAIFLNEDGKPWQKGDKLRQPQLADTLALIADKGEDVFYKGSIAEKIVKASKAHNGILTMQDFADYEVRWDKPLSCDYRGHKVLTAPAPGSGTTVCQVLGMLEPLPLSQWGYASARTSHYIIEAERRAFADRNGSLGDPAFVDNPTDKLLAGSYLKQLQESIDADKATDSKDIKGLSGGREGQHTTHYAVADEEGNAVSVTYTINSLFGNVHIAGDTGFFLNNEMDDFAAKPGKPNSYGLVQGRNNQVEGGKRPLSSMSPTLVLKDGQFYMATGSPGGSTIISTILQSILNVVDFDMNLQQAVNAPRLHHQWLPDEVKVEKGYLTDTVRQKLEDMGHTFDEVSSWGADEAILRHGDGQFDGANDRRRPAGEAVGL